MRHACTVAGPALALECAVDLFVIAVGLRLYDKMRGIPFFQSRRRPRRKRRPSSAGHPGRPRHGVGQR